MKPPFAYVGSKTKECEILNSYIPDHSVYIEPFAGSAALFWYRESPTFTVLNDLNIDVMSIYDLIKNCSIDDIINRYNNENKCKEAYNEYKKYLPEDPFEYGYRNLFLLKNAYRNILKYNSNGDIISACRDPMLKNIGIEQKHQNMLDNVELSVDDYRNVISNYDSEDTFVYLDPPYLDTKTYKDNFVMDDYNDMINFLSESQSKWLLNIPYKQEIYDVMNGYNILSYDAKYSINGDKPEHLIIMNY